MAIDLSKAVTLTELPPVTTRGGRVSSAPILRDWLAMAKPGSWVELPSDDEDGAHPVSRVTQVRKLAADNATANPTAPVVKIETRAVTSGKRYRIFAGVVAKAVPNGKAPAPVKA